MGVSTTTLDASKFLLEAPSPSIVIGAAKRVGQPYAAFALSGDDHLARYRVFLQGRRVQSLSSPTALFGSMIRDPDGNSIEISAELETMKKGPPGKKWMGARQAINLWGEPWIRDTGAPAQH